MKKILSLLLALCIFGVFCACSNVQSSAAPSPSLAAVSKLPGAAVSYAPSAAPSPSPTAKPSPVPSPVTPAQTAAPATEVPENPADKYISPVFSESTKYTDKVNNKYELSFAIPSVKGESEDIQQVNNEIYDALYPYVAEAEELMDKGVSLVVTGTAYDAYLSGDVLSIVAAVKFDYDYTDYYTWSVDVKTGLRLSPDDLLAISGLGLDGTPLSDVTAASVGAYYSEKHDITAKQWRELFDKTMEADNLAQSKYYFDADGKLQAIVKLYIPAGPAYQNTVVPMTR